MKHYQVDCTVVTRFKRKTGSGYDAECYHIGLFVCACNPYNAVILAHNKLMNDFHNLHVFSVNKVEEVKPCEESE